MSQRYLLDTKIILDLIKNPNGNIYSKISQIGEEKVFTSIIVASEIRFGICKKASTALTERVEAILSNIDVLPFDEPLDRNYAELRNYLEKNVAPIGPNDILIAAQALASNSILVTANSNEFSRVPGLSVENWLV